ncbi:LOW QUALITY PROTEIN: hypothetical protein PHMEG_00013270 [Phytophthora megakarya]|uniref:Integrase catalytic domain-containing protein n=1 Tax=Phytophthora megakarya TaxID=4795 RepID=A0A225W6N2_9STRA|nr:LOW QUALITY PROTEIN: hypothetical protein PHMEG_00013270 [Phytophthora megakarya]
MYPLHDKLEAASKVPSVVSAGAALDWSTEGTTALVDWWKRFGAPLCLESDQVHFKNELITQVCKKLNIDQSLVVVYAPWINGTVTRLIGDVLNIIRVLLIEYKLDTHEWVYLLLLVQGSLNHTPVRSLGDKAPSEVYTGLPRLTPFEHILLDRGQHIKVLKASTLPADYCSSLAGLHWEEVDQREKRRLQNMTRSKGIKCNFSVGEFVLWPRIDTRVSTGKRLARWGGSFVVVVMPPFFHHSPPRDEQAFCGSWLATLVLRGLQFISQRRAVGPCNQGMVLRVEAITNHRKENGSWQLMVYWKGLQSKENS